MLAKITYPFFIYTSFIAPRKNDIWVFGCRKGYVDNTKFFFEYASDQNEFKCYWLANNKKEMLEVREKGYQSILKDSVKGYSISSFAGFSFICTGFSDVNRILSLKSTVINFWHGTPIKKLFLDSERASRSYISLSQKLKNTTYNKALTFLWSHVDFYYASNEFESKMVSNSIGIPEEKSLSLGAPRFDAIRSSTTIDKLQDLKKTYSRILLYAPTWRDSNLPDSLRISKNEYLELQRSLEALDAVLLIKPHFNTKSSEFKELGLQSSNRIIYTEDLGVNDINDIYSYIDLLITDISSAAFDYLIFDKPILIFMPDYKEYMNSNYGIYDYFLDILKQESKTSWAQLIQEIRLLDELPNNKIKFFDTIAREVRDFRSVNKSIYQDILKRFIL